MPENLSSVREFRFSRMKISLIAGVIAIFFLLSIAGFTALALKLIPDYQLQSMSVENQLLLQEVQTTQAKIEALQREIAELAESDAELRVAADLPLIDEEVRLAGMGGSLPVKGIDPAQDLLLSLEQLEKQLQIQKESYPEILRKIEENLVVAEHTPAICPLKKVRITSTYGYRRDPFTHQRKPHHGVDFGAPRGTPVYATADGVVTYAKRQTTFGKVLIVDHGYGFETVYGHLQSFDVRVGEKVKRGDQIATVGNTGRSTGPHLHYEIRIAGEPVNPMDYLFDYSMASLR